MKKLFVLIFAALLVVAFTAPAMAKFNINAVIQTDLLWFDQDAENEMGGLLQAPGAVPTDGDHSYVDISCPSWSRFNITWTNEKNVRARFEVAAGGLTYATNGSINMRHMYGAWQATPNFELMAGWSTTPFSPLAPPQSLGTQDSSHIILLGFGEFYSGRFPQVRGTWKFSDNVRLAVALLAPNINNNTLDLADDNPARAAALATNAGLAAALAAAQAAWVAVPNAGNRNALTAAQYAVDLNSVAVPASRVDNESKFPRIDVGLPCYFGPLKLYPSFFYHRQEFDNVGLTAGGLAQENDIVSWGISMGFRIGFGPLTFSGEIQTGENWDQGFTQSTVAGLYGFAPYLMANGQVSDTDEWAFWFDTALKLGPVTPHLLIGVRDSENDGMATALDDQSRNTLAVVFGVTIPVAKTFMINPEIGYYDYDDDQARGMSAANPLNLNWDNGKQLLVGLRFLVVF